MLSFLIIFPIAYAQEISPAFSSGLQDVAAEINTKFIFQANNDCEKDALQFMAAALDFKVGEDEAAELLGHVLDAIKELLRKLDPAISDILDVNDIIDAASKSESFEEFLENVKEKIIDKVGEKFEIEDELDSMQKVWDEYERLKAQGFATVERFHKEIPQCNQQLSGSWDKRRGTYLLTLNGDCACKYPKNPKLQKFTVWVTGTITYSRTNAGTYQPYGHISEISRLRDVVCKPCDKHVSMISNVDDFYEYVVNNQDTFKKGVEKFPDADRYMTNGIVYLTLNRKLPDGFNREENVFVAFKDKKIENIYKSHVPFEDKRPLTMGISTDDSTFRSVLSSKNMLETAADAIEKDKIKFAKLDKTYVTALLLGKKLVSAGEYYLSRPQGTRTATNVFLVKQQNHNLVTDARGNNIGFGAPNMNTLLVNPRFSSKAGVYLTAPPPAVTTLGGYGISGAFVMGGATARTARNYMYQS